MTSASEVQSDRNRPYMSLQRFLYHRADMLQPILPEALPAFHDTPVFSSRYGWAMVNAIEGELLFASGMRLSLADAAEVYVLPPAFATPGAAVTMPLRRDELTGYDCVWVEPISMDAPCEMSFAAGIILKDALRKTRWGSASILIFTVQSGSPLQMDREIYE